MSDLSEAFNNIETRQSTQVAALDIGSNSFHLVVARIVADSVQILHRVKQKVRLADGLDSNNILSDEAIQRGLDTLAVIAESLRGFEPDSVRIVATYTLRKANNAKVFIRAAQKIFPYPIEIISGTEEARLIYSGVAHTNQDTGQRLVVDIGGGSTEFIIGEGYETRLLRSLQMGCVSYTKRFFKNGELTSKAFKKAITCAEQELELIENKYRKLGWQTCIGTSGTIKAIMLQAGSIVEEANQGFLHYDGLIDLKNQCCEAAHIENLKLAAISEERLPVFAAGLSILIAVFKSLNIDRMSYSAAALREGVIYEMEEQLAHHDIRERTAQSLATRYDVDVEQAKRVYDTSLIIYEMCRKQWKISNKEYRNLLGWAALLHEVGLQINSRGVQRHSAYILQNVDMFGFNQEQQNVLALLVRYHRKKIRFDEIPEFWQFDWSKISKLIVILRLAVLLNIKRQEDILCPFEVQVSDNHIQLKFEKDWLPNKPIFSADLSTEVEYLSVLGIQLSFN